MLSDTMKQVNKAEAKAKKILQEAESKAAEIVQAAKTQAEQNFADAETNARKEAKEALMQAEQEGEKQKSAFASEVKEQLELSRKQALGKADAAVDAIIAGLV